MDYLTIKDLTVSTRIGVYDWEQRITQPLRIDITIPGDFRNFADDLDKTVDYESVCCEVTNLVESKAFKLIETVADCVAGFIKQKFGSESVTVSVSKPHAIKNAGNIVVTVIR